MQTLTITNDTRHGDLAKFCGEKLISYTGQTYVLIRTGRILLELGDTIEKDSQGNFRVIKGTPLSNSKP